MLVAVKDRLQALKNTYAHLPHPDISLQMSRSRLMLWDPRIIWRPAVVRRAAAMVLGTEAAAAEAQAATGKRPAWVQGRWPCARAHHVRRPGRR